MTAWDVPLGDSEVSAIAKSVERYRRSWIAKGRFFTQAERAAWGRSLGLQSAAVRRAANAQRDLRIREDTCGGLEPEHHLAKLVQDIPNRRYLESAESRDYRVLTVLHILVCLRPQRKTERRF